MNVTKQVDGRPENLKVGDELVFPKGDRWRLNSRFAGGADLSVNNGPNNKWASPEELRSILSTNVEVHRKAESVTFKAKVCELDATIHASMISVTGPDGTEVRGFSLEPFIGQTVEVTVKAVEP